MYLNLKDLKISEDYLGDIVDCSMEFSNYKDNPKVATRNEIYKY